MKTRRSSFQLVDGWHGCRPSNSTMAEFTGLCGPSGCGGWRAVPRRWPRLGRIRTLEYRAYRLFQASHATRQDREDPPDQLRGLIQESPKMGAIHDEQAEIGCRHD